MSLRLKPQPDVPEPGAFFYVYDDEEGFVGRIYDGTNTSAPRTAQPWFWGLDYFKARSVKPYYGHVSSKEDAMTKFRAAWDSR